MLPDTKKALGAMEKGGGGERAGENWFYHPLGN